MQTELDKTDLVLLQAMQANARLTSGELAQVAHLSQSPAWRRVKRMEDAGIVTGYHAALNNCEHFATLCRSLRWEQALGVAGCLKAVAAVPVQLPITIDVVEAPTDDDVWRR